jgi:cell division protein FtsI/penicillin-binding protein 2
VVIDVNSSDILAMVSFPSFDLNTARFDYDELIADKNAPLSNRAIYRLYPPGSSIKPLILVAGLESKKITSDEVISCPPHRPPAGWPQCWITRQYSSIGHDDQWAGKGGNKARNAIKGSCNVYFSRLADRIDPNTLQLWFYKFGLGQKLLQPPAAVVNSKYNRFFTQSAGLISSSRPDSSADSLEQLPPINPGERRFFGIGQGSLRVTCLQVANLMAVFARDGMYMKPRIFIENDPNNHPVFLGIQPSTLDVVYDGTYAVINEINGTAYETFKNSNFNAQGVRVYGKTGSTENPEHAWFAGFAKDSANRSIAVAVIVEGGKHGSSDAAPIGRDIIRFCIDAGYIGR